MTFPRYSLLIGALALAAFSSASQAAVVFDNMTNVANGTSAAYSTSSTPNTFMGDAYTLAAGTTSITGFDLYPVNSTGTNFVALKLNVFIWGTVNTGTVNSATPAFSNLLLSTSATATGTFTTGSYFSFESGDGVTPGFTFGTPIALTGTTIGVTLNFQGSTDGVTFTSINGLDSVIAAGAAPSVGSLPLTGYYRNANSEANGNFTSATRTLAGLTNQALALRVYGNVAAVPEPETWALMALGIAGLVVASRKRRA